MEDEAYDAATEAVGEGDGSDGEHLAYRMAYETILGRVRRGKKRGWVSGTEEAFLKATIAVVSARLREVSVAGSAGGAGGIIRVWSTVSLAESPDVVADDARRQAILWRATEADGRFGVSFGEELSDSDLHVVGREEDLLPVLRGLLREDRLLDPPRPPRYGADAPTAEDAERLLRSHGEGGEGDWLFTNVEGTPGGDWTVPPGRADNAVGDAEAKGA